MADAHCQVKVGQPPHLSVAWVSSAAEWHRRVKQSCLHSLDYPHTCSPSVIALWLCPALPEEGGRGVGGWHAAGPEKWQGRQSVLNGKCWWQLLQWTEQLGALLGSSPAATAACGAGGLGQWGQATCSTASLDLKSTGESQGGTQASRCMGNPLLPPPLPPGGMVLPAPPKGQDCPGDPLARDVGNWIWGFWWQKTVL